MKCKKEFLARGVRCSIFLDTTSPSAADSILKVTQQFHATLIVAGTHGRNYIANSLLGSTARRLILKSNVPVITVRSR